MKRKTEKATTAFSEEGVEDPGSATLPPARTASVKHCMENMNEAPIMKPTDMAERF